MKQNNNTTPGEEIEIIPADGIFGNLENVVAEYEIITYES